MKTLYRAYAIMTDDSGKEWRVNIYKYETEQEAIEAAEKYAKYYNSLPCLAKSTGVHKYYIISTKEWEKKQYTGRSINDPTIRTWTVNEGNGSTLLFEGTHFEIV